MTLDNLEGLRKTGNSLFIQSFADYEWIVIDGGSNDGTRDYLEHSPARWASAPDGGIYDAMNKGLAQATGDYILFLNAGDRLAFANTLARLANFIAAEKKTPDFIYGDSREGEAYKPAHNLSHLPFGMFTHHQAMIYRRESLHGIQYDTRYKIAADYDFTARHLQHNNEVAYFPLALCIFEPGGVSQKKAALGRREQFLIRHRLKITGLPRNISIYLLQASVWTARRAAPALYWRLKSSGNKPRGFARI